MKKKRCFFTGAILLDDVTDEHPNKRTLDRVDCAKGYTKENTVACTMKANKLKNAIFEHPASDTRMSKKEFMRLARTIGNCSITTDR